MNSPTEDTPTQNRNCGAEDTVGCVCGKCEKPKQDDTLEVIIDKHFGHYDSTDHFTYHKQRALKDLNAWAATAQIQLVTELLGHKHTAGVIDYKTGLRLDVDWIEAELLEHKKQELERGK